VKTAKIQPNQSSISTRPGFAKNYFRCHLNVHLNQIKCWQRWGFILAPLAAPSKWSALQGSTAQTYGPADGTCRPYICK